MGSTQREQLQGLHRISVSGSVACMSLRLQFSDRNKMLALVDGMIRVECGQPIS